MMTAPDQAALAEHNMPDHDIASPPANIENEPGAIASVETPPEPDATPLRPAPNQPLPENMTQMAQLFEDHGELKLSSYLRFRIRPVLLEAGRFEFSTDKPLDENVPGQIGYFLTEWTGMRWIVSVASHSGSDTLDEIEDQQKQAIHDHIAADLMVKSAMDTFPDAAIHRITPLTGLVAIPDEEADLSGTALADEDEKRQIMRNLLLC